MRKNLTEIVFILDRSGSMAGLEKDTIGGFNAMIEKQKEINACGISRFPKKSDFTDEQVQAIKAYLGLGREHLNKRG